MGRRFAGWMSNSQALLWICNKKIEQLMFSLCDPVYPQFNRENHVLLRRALKSQISK